MACNSTSWPSHWKTRQESVLLPHMDVDFLLKFIGAFWAQFSLSFFFWRIQMGDTCGRNSVFVSSFTSHHYLSLWCSIHSNVQHTFSEENQTKYVDVPGEPHVSFRRGTTSCTVPFVSFISPSFCEIAARSSQRPKQIHNLWSDPTMRQHARLYQQIADLHPGPFFTGQYVNREV